jgi:hypothetical protein
MAHLQEGDDMETQITLSESEYETLVECEQAIERNKLGFIEAGAALLKIRDGKLYRSTHSTFAAYCQERLKFSDRRARQIMDAVEVAESVKSGTRVPLLTEKTARELSSVPAGERADVLTEAAEQAQGDPTAADVRKVVNRRKRAAAIEPQAAQDIHEAAQPADSETADRIVCDDHQRPWRDSGPKPSKRDYNLAADSVREACQKITAAKEHAELIPAVHHGEVRFLLGEVSSVIGEFLAKLTGPK